MNKIQVRKFAEILADETISKKEKYIKMDEVIKDIPKYKVALKKNQIATLATSIAYENNIRKRIENNQIDIESLKKDLQSYKTEISNSKIQLEIQRILNTLLLFNGIRLVFILTKGELDILMCALVALVVYSSIVLLTMTNKRINNLKASVNIIKGILASID